MKAAFFLSFLAGLAHADVYMHNPRGSNNRLHEANNNRANGNRLFDSQNNNAGGHNVGPEMYYYAGSRLTVEWTNQHGCGYFQENLACEVVLQYMCATESPKLRDGTTTNTAPDPEPTPEMVKYGKHETYEYYAECKTRERNMGLWTADQNVNGKTARFTRQNPNGNRRGYECPEERDYYPYWHPTPWKDIVVMTDSWGPSAPTGVDRCDYYRKNSQNVAPKGYCEGAPNWNNEPDCTRGAKTDFKESDSKTKDDEELAKRAKAKGVWKEMPAWGIDEPECWPAAWSRDNHLGNGLDGFANTYNWTVPAEAVGESCVLRLRYNITTGDLEDPWGINATWNGKDKSPLVQDPVLEEFYGLELAVNTAQFGRTFQDRSHIFNVKARPSSLASDARIININVRGKRGNIVQVYPAVEYDFAPNVALVFPDSYVHFQWTGSNTNPNGNDGEGAQGTDRSNVVALSDGADARPAYPLPADKASMWLDADSEKYDNILDLVYGLARGEPQSSGGKLNEASPYYDAGLIRMRAEGTFNYLSTRNNNFSNRGQKARIVVTENAAQASGFNMGAGWRFKQENEIGADGGGGGGGLKGAALAAAIVAPIAVVGLAAVGYAVFKKSSDGGSPASSYQSANGNTPSLPPRV
eukprot:TRINITY_DN4934_c0_g1_i2.p2 TRINITY_DN4934_c0_g1~~TRINITY_DN4934_c0_g1_i2.p2  ORF type:complete len:663 (-),score=386.42 TRINITY_DN4934_c0_g1_i2:120-2036(-)